ncbi:hypothetical protein D8674_037379 [Pyrus ussuriensis x Pyrus communis]|uniref:Uncharacterized protein n=1 Tax=Pyrus ussuriensis x Pyrus communis TaxID=2448454 RepID=A0A5N5H366_9ROSA|nr:hypothetical protein D8674_037379 [Pyrus ussuriensis x Pyrus communis]
MRSVILSTEIYPQTCNQGRVEEERMTCSQKVDLPVPGAPTNITTTGFLCFSYPVKSAY